MWEKVLGQLMNEQQSIGGMQRRGRRKATCRSTRLEPMEESSPLTLHLE